MSDVVECLRATSHNERVCKELTRPLSQNEEIIDDIEGRGILPRRSNEGIVTEDQVVVLDDGFVGKTTRQLPTSQISSTRTERGIIGACTEIETSSGTEKICSLDKSGPQEFSDSVRKQTED